MPEANIHHFFVNPKTGDFHLVEDGDPMLGFYYEILVDFKIPRLMGPYSTKEEAEEACKLAFSEGDY